MEAIWLCITTRVKQEADMGAITKHPLFGSFVVALLANFLIDGFYYLVEVIIDFPSAKTLAVASWVSYYKWLLVVIVFVITGLIVFRHQFERYPLLKFIAWPMALVVLISSIVFYDHLEVVESRNLTRNSGMLSQGAPEKISRSGIKVICKGPDQLCAARQHEINQMIDRCKTQSKMLVLKRDRRYTSGAIRDNFKLCVVSENVATEPCLIGSLNCW